MVYQGASMFVRQIAKICDGINSDSRWTGFWGLPIKQKNRKSALKIALILIAAAVILAALFPAGSAIAQAVDVGYKDFIYGSSASAPTGQKPQSKLWYNDNLWWGVMYNQNSSAFEIYRLDWQTQTWSTTGVEVDPRARSSADALWTGDQLFIASSLEVATSTLDTNVYVYQYSYNPALKTYTKVSTSIIWDKVIETIVIDRDTTGTLWATFTDEDIVGVMGVFVTHTTNNTSTWIPPYLVPVSESTGLLVDDISTLVAYNGKIGVMWSNQATGNINFAFHLDGSDDSADSWTFNPAVSGNPKYADDHLNIKSLQADASGQLFAVAKTSLSDVFPPNSNQPLILLLVLSTEGNWSRRTFGTVADNHTRPIILLDAQNREIYVFATVQSSGTAGYITYKKINMDNQGAQFDNGTGIEFIKFAADDHINNATSTKQQLNGVTNLVVLAGDDTVRTYFHNFIDLTDPPPDPVYQVFLPLVIKN